MKYLSLKYVLSLINRLKDKIEDIINPSVDDLIDTLLKTEAKVEKAIDKGIEELQDLSGQVMRLAAELEDKNAVVDKAYKLLHKISGLTK